MLGGALVANPLPSLLRQIRDRLTKPFAFSYWGLPVRSPPDAGLSDVSEMVLRVCGFFTNGSFLPSCHARAGSMLNLSCDKELAAFASVVARGLQSYCG